MARIAFVRAALSAVVLVWLFVASGCGGGEDSGDLTGDQGFVDDVVGELAAVDVASDHRTDTPVDVADDPGTIYAIDPDAIDADSADSSGDDGDVAGDVVDEDVMPDVPRRDAEWDDVPVPPPSFPIVRDGSATHVIVVADEASQSEKTAAAEIQSIIVQATGVELQMAAVPPGGDVPMIVVGCGLAASGLGVTEEPDSFDEGEYLIRVVRNSVVIAGNRRPGRCTAFMNF